MKKHIIVLDIIFYVAVPYLIWNYGREPLGDYYAMLLSTVPGIIYTIYRFITERKFNIAGLFIILSLLITTTVNLLSSSAESMLWNQVYTGYVFAGVFLLSMIIKKPLALYFAVDMAVLQGHQREGSIALFSVKGIFIWFQLVTLLFVIRGLFQNSLKGWLIHTYGVDGYGRMLIYMQISGWIFSALIFAGFVYASVKIDHYLKAQKEAEITAAE